MPHIYTIFIFSVIILVAVLIVASMELLVKNKFNLNRLKTNSQSLIGLEGIVVVPSDENGENGRILVAHQEWAAQDLTGNPLVKGNKVLIKSITGVTLMVEKQSTPLD